MGMNDMDPVARGLVVSGLVAGYDDAAVLQGVDLRVPTGTLVALVGPSGCGKTTLLRCVAGLHPTRSGSTTLLGRPLDAPGASVPTHHRSITLVPQEAALFPHLDVAANVGFGLPRGSRDRISHLLDLVGLTELAHRRPHELSGGQQHRVAVARALAPSPALVLLDEPFSALDARLRDDLRHEVRELLVAERATALLVTHDQAEALTLADEVAVMHGGTVLQQAEPEVLYREPEHAWTATFLGEATVLAKDDPLVASARIDGDDGTRLVVRPEHVVVDEAATPAVVARRSFRGHEWLVELDLPGRRVLMRTDAAPPPVGATMPVRATRARRVR